MTNPWTFDLLHHTFHKSLIYLFRLWEKLDPLDIHQNADKTWIKSIHLDLGDSHGLRDLKSSAVLLPFVEAKLNNCCWPSLYKNTQPVCCGRTLGTHHPDRHPRRESARNPCNPTTHTHTLSHTQTHKHTHTHTQTDTHTHTHLIYTTCKQQCIDYHCSIKLLHFSVLPFKHIRLTHNIIKSDVQREHCNADLFNYYWLFIDFACKLIIDTHSD